MGGAINNILKTSKIPKSCHERYLDLASEPSRPLTELGICFSGVSFLRRGYHVGNPGPTEWHMGIFTKAGEGWLMTPARRYRLIGGSLAFVAADGACEFAVTDDQWDIYWFYARPSPEWEPLSGREFLADGSAVLPVLELAMEGYLRERSIVPAAQWAALTALYIRRGMGLDGCRDPEREKLDKLWEEVAANPGDDWSSSRMSDAMGVSQSTLRRLTLRHYGQSPWKMVVKRRMALAESLLERTDYPLKVIADKVGYADEFVFSSAFKAARGLSPRAWRARKEKS